eukprot:gene5739-5978_t
MGVDLSGSSGKKGRRDKRRMQQQLLQDFEQMDDREVAQYMTDLRQNRLDRVQTRQDDEIVGITGLYLSITLVILFMAALANLPG